MEESRATHTPRLSPFREIGSPSELLLKSSLLDAENRFREAKARLLSLVNPTATTIAPSNGYPATAPPSWSSPATELKPFDPTALYAQASSPAGQYVFPGFAFSSPSAPAQQQQFHGPGAEYPGQLQQHGADQCDDVPLQQQQQQPTTTTSAHHRLARPTRQLAIAPVEPIQYGVARVKAQGEQQAKPPRTRTRDFDLCLGPAHVQELAKLREEKQQQLEQLYYQTQHHFAECRRARAMAQARRRAASLTRTSAALAARVAAAPQHGHEGAEGARAAAATTEPVSPPHAMAAAAKAASSTTTRTRALSQPRGPVAAGSSHSVQKKDTASAAKPAVKLATKAAAASSTTARAGKGQPPAAAAKATASAKTSPPAAAAGRPDSNGAAKQVEAADEAAVSRACEGDAAVPVTTDSAGAVRATTAVSAPNEEETIPDVALPAQATVTSSAPPPDASNSVSPPVTVTAPPAVRETDGGASAAVEENHTYRRLMVAAVEAVAPMEEHAQPAEPQAAPEPSKAAAEAVVAGDEVVALTAEGEAASAVVQGQASISAAEVPVTEPKEGANEVAETKEEVTASIEVTSAAAESTVVEAAQPTIDTDASANSDDAVQTAPAVGDTEHALAGEGVEPKEQQPDAVTDSVATAAGTQAEDDAPAIVTVPEVTAQPIAQTTATVDVTTPFAKPAAAERMAASAKEESAVDLPPAVMVRQPTEAVADEGLAIPSPLPTNGTTDQPLSIADELGQSQSFAE